MSNNVTRFNRLYSIHTSQFTSCLCFAFLFILVVWAGVVPCHSPDVWWPQPGTHAAGLMVRAIKTWGAPMTGLKTFLPSQPTVQHEKHGLISTLLNHCWFYEEANPGRCEARFCNPSFSFPHKIQAACLDWNIGYNYYFFTHLQVSFFRLLDISNGSDLNRFNYYDS